MKSIQLAVNSKDNQASALGVNIEEPAVLISRMKLPTSFDEATVKHCGLEGQSDAGERLAQRLKLTTVKGAPSIVDLSIQADTSGLARACASAIFDLVKRSQYALAEPFIADANSKLAEYQKRIDDSKSLMLRADRSGAALSAAYLASRDELKYLMDEVMRLQDLIAFLQTQTTQLTAPIYAMDRPVFPKKSLTLALGLMVGLCVGLLFVIGRRAYRRMYIERA